MNRKAWTRLALRRASRRRQTEIPPPTPAAFDAPLPPLEPPDDDREFAPWPVSQRRHGPMASS
ncbi:MAG TPA: hypothetical protein VMX54_14655, partial [Vicinamibacteria bacterium]|nr:hypothetical protein [Vicinamibacteria bacterium]